MHEETHAEYRWPLMLELVRQGFKVLVYFNKSTQTVFVWVSKWGDRQRLPVFTAEDLPQIAWRAASMLSDRRRRRLKGDGRCKK